MDAGTGDATEFIDTGKPDAGMGESDAPFEVPDAGPGWKWFAAFGPSCTKYTVPIDPKKELPAITWGNCSTIDPFSNGTTTCAEWDWSTFMTASTAGQTSVTVSADGRYIKTTRLRESSQVVYDVEEDIYDRLSLQPQAAWRFRNPGGPVSGQYNDCFVQVVLSGRGDPYLHIADPVFGGSIRGNLDQLMAATSYDRPSPAILPYPNAANSISASESTEAFLPVYGQNVIRLQRSDMSWVRAGAPDLTHPLVVKDDVFARDHRSAWYRLSRVEANGDVTVVREVSSHHMLGLADDGTSLYWLELSGNADATQAQPHLELWRSAYTREVTTFNANAQKIASLDGSFSFGIGDSFIYDGVFATNTVKEILLIRSSDGKAKILPAAANVELAPFYVDQNELWLKYIVDDRPANTHYAKVGIAWQ